ncbi:MAG TPA: GAF domain-containing sensor histidine kinase [Actinomycetes bacterium]
MRSIPLVTGGDGPAEPPHGGPSGLPEALLDVATALNSGLDREEVFGRIAAQLQRLVPFTALVIGRADPDARVVTPVFVQGGGPEQELVPRIPFGEGLTGRAAETGEVVVYNADDPELVAEGAPPATDRRMLVLPLVGPDGIEGTLTLFRDGSGQPAWRDDEVHLAQLFAAQAQVAVHNAELWSAAEERAKRLAAMNGILQAASGSLDVAAICRAYEQGLRDLIPFESAAIAMRTAPGVVSSIWQSENIADGLGGPLPPGSAPLWAIRHQRGYVIRDIRTDLRFGHHPGLQESGAAAVVAVPLVARGQAFGAIGLGHGTPGLYDERTLALLEEVGRQLAAALDTAVLHQEVLERKANQSALLGKLISAQEEERQSIANDLHDDTVQVLAAALVQLDHIAATTPEQQPELLRKLRSTLRSTMESARKLMFDLRPPVLDAEGLVAALRQQLDLLGTEAGVNVELDCDLEERLGPTTETVLFRSLQEALRNVRKHARAANVRLELRREAEGQVEAVLSDDGVGFDVAEMLPKAVAGGHLGLHALLERIDLAGGKVDLRSNPGEGTRLRITVPADLGGVPT